jgi:putative peptidoglycan lipid II flippase
VSLALFKPLGIAGLVIGTAAANAVMTWLQFTRLRRGLRGRLDGRQTLMITMRIFVAAAVSAAAARGIWVGLDDALGRGLVAQIVAVGVSLLVAAAIYVKLVLMMRIPEARQIEQLVRGRFARTRPAH